MLKYLFVIIYLIISTVFASPIKDIIIIGNEITKKEFILNTIQQSIGDTINPTLTNQDFVNLDATGLFENVTVWYSYEDSLYSIILFEKPYKIVKPSIEKDDIIGTAIGGEIIFDNINGENKKFELSMLFGDHSLYNLTYMNPKLKGTQDTLKVDIYNKQFENIENEYIVNRLALQSLFSLPLSKTYAIQLALAYEYNHLNILINNRIEYNHLLSINMLYQKKNTSNDNTFNIHYRATLFDRYYNNNNMIKLIHKYYMPFLRSSANARFLIQNQLQINLSNIIPIYDKIYIGTEDYVRGYKANPAENNIAIQNQLKWNNIIVSTLQWETVLKKKSYFNINFLLFMDFGIGSNNYKKFKVQNKIRGHGMGIRLDILKFVNLDLCLGINPFGEKEFHVIVNTKKF